MANDKKRNQQKAQFQAYRKLPVGELWARAQSVYPSGSDVERQSEVALIRAVGVVVGEGGDDSLKAEVRAWLVGLLDDSLETVRRYVITALPRLAAGEHEEKALLALLDHAASEREKTSVVEALQKIGGDSTLQAIKAKADISAKKLTEQKVIARMAREEAESRIAIDKVCRPVKGVRIVLRCRGGMEQILEREVQASPTVQALFPRVSTAPGAVILGGDRPFRLVDIYALRCFDTLNFALGKLPASRQTAIKGKVKQQALPPISLDSDAELNAAVEAIVSPASLAYIEHCTEGPWRYRVHMDSRKRQGREVAQLTERVYAREPRLLNDARQAPWTVFLRPDMVAARIELSPHGAADPRFRYRQGDVPAASHPPLAAALSFLARARPGDVVWDPFCGSGTELVEFTIRAAMNAEGKAGAVRVIGTDLSEEALATAAKNWVQAGFDETNAAFCAKDFRQWRETGVIEPASVDCIISNPPMGRRVPVRDLRSMINDLFVAATEVLKPGGSLVIANPMQMGAPEAFRRTFRAKVDMAGFPAWIERHTLR